MLRFYAETDLVGELAAEFAALITAAEVASEHTCERCGADAQLCSTGQSYQLYKILCPACCEHLQADDGIRYRLVRASAASDTGEVIAIGVVSGCGAPTRGSSRAPARLSRTSSPRCGMVDGAVKDEQLTSMSLCGSPAHPVR